ncbi:hypothetical protein Snas_4549 [Stackebrandtia nassauensis DSM 44728]|uniref:DUF3558 domain-containing protein n=1 Tax=Stackebrandtia nassauensis (strain DSM 44728 / CIP 108903 / NRRL B-16338 / NBRC 102104 / LLR-40K-21) TaxID=446470 RepID=D3Q6F0_STANL|nr:hypothetical protein Snas_4549 [Stackebrandtia nassauensis DSM 44728]
MRSLKVGVATAALAAVAVTSGCGLIGDAGAKESSDATPSDAASSTPGKDSGSASPTGEAAEAGGICEYLDFASLKKATGQAFTIAEAGGSEVVNSCVIQTTEGSFPDVTLTKAKTATDAKTYEKEIPPKDHDEVKDLGKAAYSAVRKPVEKSGPVVEIGWLTKGHMYSLRYTTVSNTASAEADAAVDALVDVARDIYKASGKK